MPVFPKRFLKVQFSAPLLPSAFAKFFSTSLGHQLSIWQGFQKVSNQEQVLTFLTFLIHSLSNQPLLLEAASLYEIVL